MEHYEKKFKWCLNKGDTGEEKHRGLRKIKPDKKLAKSHIEKALHNLEAIEYNIKGGFGDWAVSASFLQCITHCWQFFSVWDMNREIRNALSIQLNTSVERI